MILPKIWSFLECILDENFLELETHISLPKMDPDSKLIPTIADCSPLLQKLKLNFEGMKKEKKFENVEKLKPVILSLNSLDHLTCLSLHNLDKSYRRVLRFLGKLKLSHLSLGGFNIETQDVLAIVLGELLDNIPESDLGIVDGIVLNVVQIPSEYLTPLCSTLSHLEIGETVGYREASWKINFSTAAFALLHLPCLQKMGECEILSRSIVFLHHFLDNSAWARYYKSIFRTAAAISSEQSSLPAFSGKNSYSY